jgi:hypothetical protein
MIQMYTDELYFNYYEKIQLETQRQLLLDNWLTQNSYNYTNEQMKLQLETIPKPVSLMKCT